MISFGRVAVNFTFSIVVPEFLTLVRVGHVCFGVGDSWAWSVWNRWTVGKIFEPSIFVDEFLFTVSKMSVNQPTTKRLWCFLLPNVKGLTTGGSTYFLLIHDGRSAVKEF